jgi:hypothetical protein
MPEIAEWVQEEFGSCELGDARLESRLLSIVNALGARPDASLPHACANPADLKALYRFMSNPTMEDAELLAGHQLATRNRILSHPVVLAVQDTTFLDYTDHPATKGLGNLVQKYRQGICLHSTLAFTPERLPLGVFQLQMWTREESELSEKEQKARPIEEKESYRWLKSLQEVKAWAPVCPDTLFVSVGDREADIYDLFLEQVGSPVHLLIRSTQNRLLFPSGKLHDEIASAPIQAEKSVQVPKQGKQKARVATLSVRFESLSLRPPKDRAKEHLAEVTLGVVLVQEERPPAGCAPLSWLLLTTLPLTSAEEACAYVDWYCVRWQIEVWHKVLKSGCRIEALQLAHADRLKTCLTLYAVLAWRLLYATMLGRVVPDMSCEILLDADEWKTLYCHIHRQVALPEHPPTLQQAIGWIGRMGGHLGRKRDGPPGIETLWKGFQRLNDMTDIFVVIMNPQNSLQATTLVGKG